MIPSGGTAVNRCVPGSVNPQSLTLMPSGSVSGRVVTLRHSMRRRIPRASSRHFDRSSSVVIVNATDFSLPFVGVFSDLDFDLDFFAKFAVDFPVDLGVP